MDLLSLEDFADMFGFILPYRWRDMFGFFLPLKMWAFVWIYSALKWGDVWFSRALKIGPICFVNIEP